MNVSRYYRGLINHLLSEDDVMLHQLLGEAHRVLDVDIVILGAVYHHQSSVPHTVTSSSHAGPRDGIISNISESL